MPKVSDRYFIVDGTHAFVPTDVPGLYAITHPSTLFVACAHCDAKPGERCKGRDGKAWHAECHYVRREAGREPVRTALAANNRIGKLPAIPAKE